MGIDVKTKKRVGKPRYGLKQMLCYTVHIRICGKKVSLESVDTGNP
jgi:hypothetical protein